MSESGSWSVRRPEVLGRRVPRTLRSLERRPFEPLRDAEGPAPAADTVPTILVAGIVTHLERFQELGYIRRARWSVVVPGAVRGPADLVVVGTPSNGVGAAAVVAELKRDAAAAAIPVLHVFASDAPCGGCGAEICVDLVSPPTTLVGAARCLLELRRSRQELRRELVARELPARVAEAPIVVAPIPPDPGALPRAQRLEALGRLTGGVAHDINNMLGVITGQVEFALQRLPSSDPVRGRVAQVLPVVERAAGLTRQLLAFSREPAGRPRPVDLNVLVGQLERILDRAVGDEVELEVRPGPALGFVHADPTHLEQILLNLAFNARDAMPSGGRLTVETHNVDLPDGDRCPPAIPPGRYVMLSVSDDGTGMDAATLARIFEPFFTTKGEGRGTGLGLATVHTIVTRAGGVIRVDSERGLGTTFRVYLPRVDAARREVPRADPEPPDVSGGSETVLVAEDSEAVREVTCGLLEALGYRVLSAAHGIEALALAREHAGPIHLLLADVVMPKLGGPSLAEQIAELRPETRVLYMSGYGDDAVSGRGQSEPAVLRKPFSQDRLARAVRQALGGDPPGAAV